MSSVCQSHDRSRLIGTSSNGGRPGIWTESTSTSSGGAGNFAQASIVCPGPMVDPVWPAVSTGDGQAALVRDHEILLLMGPIDEVRATCQQESHVRFGHPPS